MKVSVILAIACASMVASAIIENPKELIREKRFVGGLLAAKGALGVLGAGTLGAGALGAGALGAGAVGAGLVGAGAFGGGLIGAKLGSVIGHKIIYSHGYRPYGGYREYVVPGGHGGYGGGYYGGHWGTYY